MNAHLLSRPAHLGAPGWMAALAVIALAPVRADIVLTEIHYHPVEEEAYDGATTYSPNVTVPTAFVPSLDLTDDVHEFVEIQNTGTTAVSLAGWTLAGGIDYTFPAGTTLAAGAFKVIARNPTRIEAVYALTSGSVLGPYTGKLGNNSDTVRLKDASGTAVDAVTYDSKFPWAASADALGAQDRFTGLTSNNYQYKGRSLQRVSVTWPSSDPANWLASPLSPGPTPGSAQAVTRTIPKPVVVAQSAVQTGDGAAIVRASQAVTVNCTFSDTTSLTGVQLEYFVDDINSTSETKTAVTMTDQGSGKFTGAIPGQADRSVVRYRFKANRGEGVEVVSPRADDPQIAPIGTSGALESWHGYFVTPVRSSSNPIYDVFVSTAALTQLNTNIVQNPRRATAATAAGLPRSMPWVVSTAPQWDGTQHGVFACNGEVYDIQIRYHGSRYHRASSNSSFKLHFPSHTPFMNQSAWFITKHGNEFVEAQKLNRLLGIPSSKMFAVDWYYNSNALSSQTQQGEYGNEMLDEYHELQQQLNPGTTKEDRGDLFKDVGNRDSSQNNLEGPYTCGDLAPVLANANWTQLQRYEWTYSIQSNTWKGPKQMRDMLEGMWTVRGDAASHNGTSLSGNATNLANTKAWFNTNYDMDLTLTSMALLEWLAIWDDGKQNQFYWRRASGKWSRLGWDYDQVMSTSTGGMGGGYTQSIYGGEYGSTIFDGVNWWKDTFYKCFRTEYNQRLWELNNSFLDPTNLTAMGFTTAPSFAALRQSQVNSQLSSYGFGTFYKPARPTNSAPAGGSTILSSTNLTTSAYSTPNSSAHTSTKWEIRSSTGNYEEPVLRVTSTTNLVSYPVPFDQLTYGQTYYWRATHIDAAGHSSIVSAETSFTWGTSSTTAGTIVLNEVLANNRNTVQNGGSYPDYVEIRNNGATTASIAGYTLTDDPLIPAKYTFPAGTTIAAGGHLIVWCDNDTSASGIHSGFGLNTEGDQILLLNGTTIVDNLSFGPQAPDLSIGRITNGTGGWQANTPTPATANSAKTLGSVANLRVNEWMANPAYGDDWFEICNTDSNPVALAGLYLSDSASNPTTTQIPALSFIAGKGQARFWADGSTAGGSHCNFKLNNSGESIVLTATNGATALDTITFSSQTKDVSQGRLPDGATTIVSFSSQTASPGYTNWAPAAVYINELLANASSPFEDAIEIHNPTASAVSIAGWWLSDDIYNRQKFQIPAGTTVPAGGYKVFYASDLASGTVPFEFSALGDEAVLSAVDGSGNLTGYASFVRFGASAENVSFGRVAATGLNCSSGGAEFWPQATHSFGQDNPANVAAFRTGTGAANGSPKIGPLVINEIQYHPVDGSGGTDNTQDEFVEIQNISGGTLDLGGWRLKGDAEFTFPSGTALAANAYLLVVSFDPSNAITLAAFRTTYGLSASVPVYGPYSEKLANSTMDVEIASPATIASVATYVNVDKTEYRDLSPWPTTPDGTGKSLQRTSGTLIGNTAANWAGDTPTPGALNAGVLVGLAVTSTSPLPGGVLGQSYSATLAASGGIPPYTWSQAGGSLPNLTLGSEGSLGGTPNSAGAFTFTAQVTDSATTPATATKQLTVTIAASALAITTASPLPDGTAAVEYSQTLAATGGTMPYTWSVASGSLPTGLTLNAAGVVGGTTVVPGTYSFTARVADNGGLETTKAFNLYIPIPPLTVTSATPMLGAELGAYYSQALTAVGGVTPYAWTLASGALPTGLTLSATGDITGTPSNYGTFNFTAQVTDNASTVATKAMTLTVTPQTLVITTSALSGGTLNDSCNQALAASGGVTPYTWSVASGSLPNGTALSSAGVLTGGFTAAGTYTFTAQVSDFLHVTATRQFIVTVAASGPLDHLTWDYVPSTAYANKPFAVHLTARDSSNRIVTSLNSSVTVSAASGLSSLTSPVIITEVTDEQYDQFEIQNVTNAAVDTTGWFVRLGDTVTDINGINAITYMLPSSSLAAGGLLRISESGSPSGLNWGSAINWTSSGVSKGWIMLFDAQYNLRDFVTFGWTTTDLALLSVLVNGNAVTATGQWSGSPLAAGTRGSGTIDSWQRQGTADTNTAADWLWKHNANNTDATSFGVTNTGLTIPWATTTPVTMSPTTLTLVNGEFYGYVTVTQTANDVHLTANDGANHTVVSGAITVAAGTDSDSDGLPDAYETANGLTVGINDANLDADKDGQSNYVEWLAGTNPQSATSRFAITAEMLGAGSTTFTVSWPGVAGRLYRVETSDTLGTWTAHMPLVLPATTGTQQFAIPVSGSKRFARIVIVPSS